MIKKYRPAWVISSRAFLYSPNCFYSIIGVSCRFLYNELILIEFLAGYCLYRLRFEPNRARFRLIHCFNTADSSSNPANLSLNPADRPLNPAKL
ncbi:hypothetical protein [Bacillus sp. E214]|uniref:hypothetical protein n=1 Tax=Bacillus sp. E214 TaxID=2587156 RepID=UPI0011E04CA5|nr:hypothetical protein [Bacillus sp. E214]